MIDLNINEKRYNDSIVFQDAHFKMRKKGKIHLLTGNSGSGKTTLMNILFGLDQQFSGRYSILGKDAFSLSNQDWDELRSHKMSVVFQDYKLISHLTVFETLFYAGNSNHDSDKQIDALLDDFHLKSLKEQPVTLLSGGEKQRLAIARAIINKPEFVMMDEPTRYLDKENITNLIHIIQKIVKKNIAILLISHDNRLKRYSDHVYMVRNRKITPVEEEKYEGN